MKEFSEKEKRFIVKNQSVITLQRLGKILKCSPEEVYECYSDMIDTGEHLKYYEKPECFQRKEEDDEEPDGYDRKKEQRDNRRFEAQLYLSHGGDYYIRTDNNFIN